ncbi:hypothetical protein [Paenibacillus sp. PK3_47]|uniref:hypothetical protein n=1 Tax=Paenibacillus sp. PK3_47 TaxID=2072642 RepID=UPI00201D9CCB|nr:hypothetical protein [Paenibacillus sp. PK3_47]
MKNNLHLTSLPFFYSENYGVPDRALAPPICGIGCPTNKGLDVQKHIILRNRLSSEAAPISTVADDRLAWFFLGAKACLVGRAYALIAFRAAKMISNKA